MKERLLTYLACPSCAGELRLLSIARREGAEVIEGDLDCAGCARHFPIVRGVPRFAALEKF
ncbi:MAG: Trm112 family protein [Acidobacteria bacterium]|nr:Trm112 family protein [Acidobacteriota bacterium]